MTRLRWAGAVALVGLATSACGMGGGGSADATNASGDDGHIVYDEFFAPAAAWAPSSDDAQVLSRVGCVETLLKYDYDGALTENLATSWEQVKPTVWSFTLRDGVTFQNGTAMDAEAVTGALQHLLDAETPARAFNPTVVSGVKAVDAQTVEITTPAPDVLLPLRTASANTGILAPEAYEGDQVNIEGTCTGPFTVVEETPGQSLKLERNDEYWGGKGSVATAEVRFVPDGAARVTQIQTGEADISTVIPAVSVSQLESDSNIELSKLPSPRTASMLLNNSRPPFDDPLVRQAIQHALDTEAIAAAIYEGVAVPAAGPFSPEDPWAPAGATPAAFDQDEARSLLDQAGVDPKSLSFELIAYNDRPEFADLAAVIQDQLAQLGIKVKIHTSDYASVEPAFLSGDFDAALFSRGYLIDVADPAGYVRSDWSCDGTFNIAHYCDPDVDALLKQAVETEDGDARHEVEVQIAQKLQDDAASAFLVHESLVTAVRSDVKGFEPHPLNLYVLTNDLSVG